MDINYDKNFFLNYMKNLNPNQVNQVYNIKNKNNMKMYLLQFKQLINYFNFKNKLNEELTKKRIDNNPFTIDKMFLIDKNWIQKWKNHVGYNEIKEKIQKYQINRELNVDDYNWIEPIISKNAPENFLSPIDNSNIYYNNNINPLADFIIVNEICYQLFTVANTQKINSLNNKSFPIKIFKEKLILTINEKIYLFIFKEKLSNNYFELLIIFNQENSDINKVLFDLEKEEANEWIKKMNINLISKIRYSIDKYGFKFEIINKSLQCIQKKNLRNTLIPRFNKGEEELLNIKGEISRDLEKEMKTQMIKNLNQIKTLDINKKEEYFDKVINGKNKKNPKEKVDENNESGKNNNYNNNNDNEKKYKENNYSSSSLNNNGNYISNNNNYQYNQNNTGIICNIKKNNSNNNENFNQNSLNQFNNSNTSSQNDNNSNICQYPQNNNKNQIKNNNSLNSDKENPLINQNKMINNNQNQSNNNNYIIQNSEETLNIYNNKKKNINNNCNLSNNSNQIIGNNQSNNSLQDNKINSMNINNINNTHNNIDFKVC